VQSSGKQYHYGAFVGVSLTLMVRQDLNSSVISGSNRIFDHTTFAELQWRRDPFSSTFYSLPPGFQKKSHLLTEKLVEILEDVHALQCIRDSVSFRCEDTTLVIYLDNHQASIQSRLVALPNRSVFLDCCQLATYLSSCMLCPKFWRVSPVPVRIFHPFRKVH
jgi:hypothetical protein